MKIAMYWNNAYPLVATTVRHDLYASEFRRLGHDVVTACLAVAADGVPGRVVTFTDPEEPRSRAFWDRIAPDLLVVVTWLSLYRELEAARAAGARVVAISDSDGQVGFGAHRRHVLYRSVMQHPQLRQRIGAVKYFGQRLLNRRDESAQVIRSVEASDAVLMNTEVSVEHLGRFLQEEGREDLAARVGVCPYPIDPRFHGEVPARKVARGVAVGRWDSMQKDGPLLRDALGLYYDAGGTMETHLFGSGMELFEALAARHRAVVCRGSAAPTTVAETMHEAHSLLLTSRWESGPIVAFEALSQGCTLVSTDIPNMRELAGDGQFGTIASARTPAAFSQALRDESAAWDAGRRDPRVIAARWRPSFSAEMVCRRILRSLPEMESCVSAGDSRARRH